LEVIFWVQPQIYLLVLFFFPPNCLGPFGGMGGPEPSFDPGGVGAARFGTGGSKEGPLVGLFGAALFPSPFPPGGGIGASLFGATGGPGGIFGGGPGATRPGPTGGGPVGSFGGNFGGGILGGT